MKPEHDMNSRDAVAEANTLTPLEGGKYCPPFKARLFELADAELAARKPGGSELTPRQSELQAHVALCPACAAIYQSGLYFGSIPELSDSEGAMAQLAKGWEQNDLRILQEAAKKKPYVNGTLSGYVSDLAASAGISCRNALLALGYLDLENPMIDVLDKPDEVTVRAGIMLGLNEQDIALALVSACAATLAIPRRELRISEHLEDLLRSTCEGVRRLLLRIDAMPSMALKLLQRLGGISDSDAKAWVEHTFYCVQRNSELSRNGAIALRPIVPTGSGDVDFAALHYQNMKERPVDMKDCYAITR